MQQAQVQPMLSVSMDDTGLLRKQLQREITCLEMQLERLRRRAGALDLDTLKTYEEMICSRQDVLESI